MTYDRKDEVKDVAEILERILKDLNISEEELLFDNIYHICNYKATPKDANSYYVLYMSADEKTKYPKDKITDYHPIFGGDGIYAYQRYNRNTMWSLYRDHICKQENLSADAIHHVCYEVVEMLFDGLIAGFVHNMYEYRSEVKPKARVKEYLLSQHFGSWGNAKHFTDLNDSPSVMKTFKTPDDVKEYAFNEIKNFILKKSFFVFAPAKVSEEEIAKDKIRDVQFRMKTGYKEIKDEGLKKLFIEEIQKMLEAL